MLTSCCCTACIIGKDEFSANDGDPHAGWTYDNTFSTVVKPNNAGGVWLWANPAIEIFNTPHPDGASGNFHVKVNIKLHENAPGLGVEAGIIVGWLDATIFLYVVLVYDRSVSNPNDCSYLEFWGRDTIAGGRYFIDSIPIRGLTLDEFHELHVCLIQGNYGTYSNSDTLRAYVKLADGTFWGWQVVADGFDDSGFTGGAQVGLIYANDYGTPDALVTFDRFEFDYFRESPDHRSCPNCNTPCFVFDDDFTQANGTFVSCFWQLTGGAADIDTNHLVLSGSGVLKCLLPLPQAKTAGIVTVSILFASDTKWKIVAPGGGYLVIASGSSGSSTVTLYNSVNTQIDTATVSGGIVSVELCHFNGLLTATLATGDCLEGTSTDNGDSFAYLADGGGLNDATFDNFSLSKHWDTSEPNDGGCERCSCPQVCDNCQGGFSPSLWKLVIPADISNGGSCTNCPNAAGSYVIGLTTPPSGECSWQGPNLDVSCTTFIDIWIVLAGPGDVSYPGTTYRLYVFMRSETFPNPAIIWANDYGLIKPDCLNFVDEPIGFSSNLGGSDGCMSGGLPVLLTAI